MVSSDINCISFYFKELESNIQCLEPNIGSRRITRDMIIITRHM